MGVVIHSASPIFEASFTHIILEANDLVIASRIYELILHVGDDVIVSPSASGQLYYLIDKVGVPHVS